jgi:hypothetical protein
MDVEVKPDVKWLHQVNFDNLGATPLTKFSFVVAWK